MNYRMKDNINSGRRLMVLAAVFMLMWMSSCKKDAPIIADGNQPITLQLPKGFPAMPIPEDNPITRNKIELGRILFFDPILSRDSSVSCASCHLPELKFTDGLPVSVGIDNQTVLRNSMSLINVGYQPYMFWDGGSPTLEQQVSAPIESPLEMDFNIPGVVERLKKSSTYREWFKKTFHREPDAYGLTRALATYQRSLLSGKSKFDRYQYYGETNALNESEKNGMNIFFGERGECFHCHGGYNFTDYTFKNNGLYLHYADSGRARITELPEDVGKFKVPSLRNIALTAPYMHDGSMTDLNQVIEHYNSGGKPHPNKSGLIQPLNFTPQEKADLLAFLNALTDE